MIEPGNSRSDRRNGRAIRQRGSLEHENGDTERSGCCNLAVCSLSAAVLRDDGIDGNDSSSSRSADSVKGPRARM